MDRTYQDGDFRPVVVSGPTGPVVNWSVEEGYQPPTPVLDRQMAAEREAYLNPPKKPRMTIRQVRALWELCDRYNVPFREDDYYQSFDLPTGYFTGWIGGWKPGSDRKKTICVGVSPDGQVSS